MRNFTFTQTQLLRILKEVCERNEDLQINHDYNVEQAHYVAGHEILQKLKQEKYDVQIGRTSEGIMQFYRKL